MNYNKRIQKLREAMALHEVAAYITTCDANMEYLTGIPRMGGGNTKQRQHSIAYACLIITPTDIIACLPNLTYLVTKAKLHGRETAAAYLPFPDGDLTGNTLLQQLKSMGLSNAKIGVSEDVSAALVLMLQNGLHMQVQNLNDIIQSMRAVKDPEELALIKEGALITDKIYKDIIDAIRPGAVVRQLEWEIEQLIEKYGASKSSFPSEVNTQGPRAGHFVGFSSETMEKGDVIGLDYGVIFEGYCTDFGRTIFIGEPTKEHIKIYDLVLKAQNAAAQQICKGSTGEAADTAARNVLVEGGYGDRFIHKLGHAIGLDVHERPFLAKGENAPMAPGMIYAVEPSVFLPKNCFIRLEDEIAVTETGFEFYSAISREITVID